MIRPPLLPYVPCPADAPDLPVRKADDPGGPDVVVSAVEAAAGAEGEVALDVTLRSGAAARVTLAIVTPGVARVALTPRETRDREEGAATRGAGTLVRPEAGAPAGATVQREPGRIVLASPEIRVEARLSPFALAFYGPGGEPILAQDTGTGDAVGRLGVLPLGWSEVDGRRVAFHDSFVCEPDEHFYGLGEKFTALDKRGQRLVMWNYDALGAHTERAYKNVPFFFSTRGYGFYLDSATPAQFDMAQANVAAWTIAVPDEALRYYVIAGPEPATILGRYADLVGYPTLPPKWAFGLWMSSGFKDDSAADVLARAEALRAHDIPGDVMHLDCYWQRFGRWSENLWDRDMFPDPEELIRSVHALGFRVCLWINPYVGPESERFAEARDRGYLLRMANGEVFVADLWNGSHPPVAIYDLTNPDAAGWYAGQLRDLLRQGVDVFKTDFGEGVPAGAVAYNGLEGDSLHNLYPLIYNDIVSRVTAEETGRAGLVWARSSYAGGQRHAAQWAGDPECSFAALAATMRAGLSLGACGHAFWSHDIGGFHGRPSPDLYVRWAQFGLFSPLSRAHGTTTRLPWEYGEEAFHIFRDAVRLRYRLMPYIYSQAVVATETGLPMMRALPLAFPGDPLAVCADLEYLFGEDLLVAPILNASGRRHVYLPAGQWIDFWTHEVCEGPAAHAVTAPLDVLPLYVRSGALVPTMAPTGHLSDEPFPFVVFDGYLLDQGEGTLRDVDGATHIEARLDGGRLEVTVAGGGRPVGLRLPAIPGRTAIAEVVVNGRALRRVPEIVLAPDAAPGWTVEDGGTLVAVVAVMATE